MLILSPTRPIAILLMVSLSAIYGAAQSTKPPQLPLYLPDPTPRPDDIKQKYEDTTPKQDMSQRAVALRKAQNREQMQKAADMLVMLAQRLRDNAGSADAATTLAVSVQRASEIEVLAKIVRERMKLQ